MGKINIDLRSVFENQDDESTEISRFSMTVVTTFVHVDHSESTLINFLTERETDRLKEEKQRGYYISLGYTYFDYEK